MIIGEKIRNLRKNRKITQKVLASQVGVAISAISAYESGNRNPSYDVLISLSRVFHVSTDYLLGLDSKKVLDISDLTETEVEALTKVAEAFREAHLHQ